MSLSGGMEDWAKQRLVHCPLRVMSGRWKSVSLVMSLLSERGAFLFGLTAISRQKINYSDVMLLSSASTDRRRYRPSRFAIFSASGRTEARDGDLLEQVAKFVLNQRCKVFTFILRYYTQKTFRICHGFYACICKP